MSKIILEKNIEEYQKTKDIKYLEYTLENIKEISRLISLATDNHEKAKNIEEYQKTKDIKYLEYTLENIKEISRLISLATDNHEKAFNSTTPQKRSYEK